MPGQQSTITAFFASSASNLKSGTSAAGSGSPLRTASASLASRNYARNAIDSSHENVEDSQESPCKRRKVEDSVSASSELLPNDADQQKRAHQNWLNAKLLQQCKKTPILTKTFGLTWFEALEKEFSKEYFIKLQDFVLAERKKCTVYPPAEHVFSWTEHFPIQHTKVVILGQDPYHGPRQAHGLCFSVMKGVPPPPSLVNIFKELSKDIPEFVVPNHGDLTGWACQGVLLLNAVLTVQSGMANSHKDKGWELFTDAVIDWLNKNLKGVVFMLWGRYAQAKGSKIDKKRHHVLVSAHPSPLSVTRFMGCKHFSMANELLKKDGKKSIDWGFLP